MRFVIAKAVFFQRLGYNTQYWRKNKDENKTICHLEFAEILSHDLHNNPEAQIVDASEAKNIMKTEEWSWEE